MLKQLLDRLSDTTAAPEDDKLLPLATAALLFEVAWADHDVAEEEVRHIHSALLSEFELDEKTVTELIEESRQHHESSVGVHRFTRAITDAWDEPRRFALVVQLWRLALADQTLDSFEEHTIRKIAGLLYLSHPRFIEAKRQAKREAAAR